jgi:hypothetical protein
MGFNSGLKGLRVKVVNYGTSVCDDVAAYISGSSLVCVHCTLRK